MSTLTSTCCGSTCQFAVEGEPCWGEIRAVDEDYYGDEWYWVHACEGHAGCNSGHPYESGPAPRPDYALAVDPALFLNAAHRAMQELVDRVLAMPPEILPMESLEFTPDPVIYATQLPDFTGFSVDASGNATVQPPRYYAHPYHVETIRLIGAELPPDDPAPLDGPPVESWR